MARTQTSTPPPPLPPPAAPIADQQTARPIELKLIAESPTNPRKTYDEVKLQELANSIRETTLISPIIVRPWPSSRRNQKNVLYECVVGSRRLRAHHLLKAPAISARIVALNDAQVIEMQLIENAQRSDVHPLEEAVTYEKLLKFDGYEVETLAQKTGRTEKYVHQRLNFMKLDKKVADLFYADRINIGHATVLAHLPKVIQNDLVANHLERTFWNRQTGKEEKSLVSAAQLADVVRSEYMLQLSAAPWKLKDANLVPRAGACTACSKRTGASPGLFEEIELGKSDRCLDRTCYETKAAAHLQAAVESADATGTPLVQISRHSNVPTHPEATYVVSAGNYAEVPKAKSCQHAEQAIFADGTVGKATRICRAVLPKSERCAECMFWVSPEAAGKSGDVWADRAKALPAKIAYHQRREILRAVLREVPDGGDCFPHGALQLIARSMVPQGNYDALECLRLEYIDLETVKGNSGARELLQKHIGAEPKTPAADDLGRITVALAMADHVSEFCEADSLPTLQALAKHYGVDGAEIATNIATKMQMDFDRRRDAAKAKAKRKAGRERRRHQSEPEAIAAGSPEQTTRKQNSGLGTGR